MAFFSPFHSGFAASFGADLAGTAVGVADAVVRVAVVNVAIVNVAVVDVVVVVLAGIAIGMEASADNETVPEFVAETGIDMAAIVVAADVAAMLLNAAVLVVSFAGNLIAAIVPAAFVAVPAGDIDSGPVVGNGSAVASVGFAAIVAAVVSEPAVTDTAEVVIDAADSATDSPARTDLVGKDLQLP